MIMGKERWQGPFLHMVILAGNHMEAGISTSAHNRTLPICGFSESMGLTYGAG